MLPKVKRLTWTAYRGKEDVGRLGKGVVIELGGGLSGSWSPFYLSLSENCLSGAGGRKRVVGTDGDGPEEKRRCLSLRLSIYISFLLLFGRRVGKQARRKTEWQSFFPLTLPRYNTTRYFLGSRLDGNRSTRGTSRIDRPGKGALPIDLQSHRSLPLRRDGMPLYRPTEKKREPLKKEYSCSSFILLSLKCQCLRCEIVFSSGPDVRALKEVN